jgi:hypothetical protein
VGRPPDKDDIGGLSCIHVADPALYESKEPFGPDVTAKFPNTITDLQEASKCHALNLSTASVFHLMRALDAAMRDFIAALRASVPQDRDWQSYLNASMKPWDGCRPPTNQNGPESRKWHWRHRTCTTVKLAWRNGVMHPRDSYSPEEAREVYDAVKTFIRHLTTVL